VKEKPLAGQTALVTGGARRIGRSIALALGDAGASVAVHYNMSHAEANDVVGCLHKVGAKAVALQADLSIVDSIRPLAAEAEEKLGAIDILINNAAIFEPIRWDKITEKDWNRFLDTNLKAQFFLAQAVAAGMKERGQGTIINLASMGGMRVWPSYIPYGVSKAGLIHLTKLLAKALAPEVRVNAIAPGTIEFEDSKIDEKYALKAPLGRTGTGDEIAATALFLCTSANYITGQIFVVDGGQSLV
jgi:3-oxoacyl-[acyl-carrier protein] reductase/pteridine reductase